MINKTSCLPLESGKYAYTNPYKDDFSQYFYLATVLRLTGGNSGTIMLRKEAPEPGYALQFNGENSYVITEDSGLGWLNTSITIRVWYKPSAFEHDSLLLACDNGNGFWLKLLEGKRLCAGGGDRTIITADPEYDLTDTEHWYQLVYTRKYMWTSIVDRLYINGVLVKQEIEEGALVSYAIVPPYLIGGSPEGMVCNGAIDEVAVYSDGWDETVVLQDYNNGHGIRGKSTDLNLVAGYHLDEGNGNVVEPYDRFFMSYGTAYNTQWIEGLIGIENVPWVLNQYYNGWRFENYLTLSGNLTGNREIRVLISPSMFVGLTELRILFELFVDFQNQSALIFLNGIPSAGFTPSELGETEQGFFQLGGFWEGKIEMLAIDNKKPDWLNMGDPGTWYHFYLTGDTPLFTYPEITTQFLHFYDFDKIENGWILDLGSNPKNLLLVNIQELEPGLTGYLEGKPFIAHEGLKARIDY